MNWMDIGKQAIQMGAPILGGALGGPAGAAVGAWVAGQFGGGRMAHTGASAAASSASLLPVTIQATA